MTGRPLTYADVEDELRSTMARVETMVEEYAVALDAEAQAKADYEIGVAEERLRFRSGAEQGKRPTDQMVADHALVAMDWEYRRHLTTKAVATAKGKSLYSLNQRCDTLRSFMASYRQAAG